MGLFAIFAGKYPKTYAYETIPSTGRAACSAFHGHG